MYKVWKLHGATATICCLNSLLELGLVNLVKRWSGLSSTAANLIIQTQSSLIFVVDGQKGIEELK